MTTICNELVDTPIAGLSDDLKESLLSDVLRNDDSVNLNRQMLRAAYRVGTELSGDPRTRLGAVMFHRQTGRLLAVGYNDLPPGVDYVAEHVYTDKKLEEIVHAEEMAIFNTAASNYSTKGLAMACPWACCHRCARAIISAGVSELVVHEPAFEQGGKRWEQSIAVGHTRLMEAGVRLTRVCGKLGKVTSLFSNKWWEP